MMIPRPTMSTDCIKALSLTTTTYLGIVILHTFNGNTIGVMNETGNPMARFAVIQSATNPFSNLAH